MPISILPQLSQIIGQFPYYPNCHKLYDYFHITPIVTNYRPISILPQLSLIFEKHFEVRLSDFICKNKILNQSQY